MFEKTAWNFASQALSFFVSIADRFFLVAILLRVWSTVVYSDWVTLSACAGLLALCDFGFVIFLGNKLQKAFSSGGLEQFQRVMGFGIFIYCVLVVVLFIVLVGLTLSEILYHFISVRTLGPSEAASVVFLLGAAQIINSAKSAFTQIFRARGAYARGSLIDSISALAITTSAIIGASSGASPILLATIYICASTAFGWGTLVACVRRFYPDLRLRPVMPNTRDLREVGAAMKSYALIYAAPSIWLQAPILLLGLLGVSGIGLVSFVVHRSFVNSARTFTMMLSIAAGVELSSYVHIGNADKVERGISLLGRMIAACGGVLAVGLLCFGAPVIQFWTAKLNLFDEAILFWLVVPIVTVAPAIPLLSLAQYADLPKPVAISNFAQIAVGIFCCLLLGYKYGASGVAAGLAVGETLAIGVLFPALITTTLRIKYLKHAGSCLAVSLLSMLWAWIVALVIGSIANGETPLMLFVAVSSWGVLALIPVAYLALPTQQRELFDVRLRKLIAKRDAA